MLVLKIVPIPITCINMNTLITNNTHSNTNSNAKTFLILIRILGNTGIDTNMNAPTNTNSHVQNISKNTRINVPKNVYFHIPMYQHTKIRKTNILIY